MTTTRYFTVGDVAEAAGIPAHEVNRYVGRKHIRPAVVVGNYRGFDREQAERMVKALMGRRRVGAGSGQLLGV